MTKTDYQKFIAVSRYARWLDDENRRETWKETVDRYIKHVVEPKVDISTTEGLRQRITNLDVMPSMRALMTAGEALTRDNTCGYNCSYLPVDDPKSFDEAMFILLCGTGVGFSVERQFISKLPEVPTLFDSDTVVVVKDSKEGWAKGFRQVLALLWSGEIPKWDVSRVRPAGARLKTFGGRASGPGPLVELFEFAISTFKAAQGRKLNSLECHDLMCKVGEIVVVGGVRRSAMISLSNLSDDRMRHAKSGNWWDTASHRALSNNSVCYTEKPDAESFMREWLALIESKSGERGIFSRVASVNQVKRNNRRDPDWEFGTNPCCFTGDMKLLTGDGYHRFDELVGEKSVRIVSSDGTVSDGKVWSSGMKPTVLVSFSNNLNKRPIKVTDDHVFQLADGTECQAKDLKGKRVKFFSEEADRFLSGSDFLAGFMLGDANLNRLNSSKHLGLEVYFDREKDKELAEACDATESPCGRLVSYSRRNRQVAIDYGLPAKPIGARGFPEKVRNPNSVRGLFSANGSVIKGHRVAIKSTDYEQLVDLQKYLQEELQIESYITTNKPKVVKFSNGEYECKESYDLNISRFDSLLKFSSEINFGQTYKREALRKLISDRSPKVISVKPGQVEEVYDFTEPKNHWGVVEGVVAHNSEIILRPYQFCNLTEVVVRREDTVETLADKVRYATILGTIQSTLTKFPYLRKVWQKNTEEERLLGVSLTGITDNPLMTLSNVGLGKTLQYLRKVAVETNAEWSDFLDIERSTAITCVKPSGTVSQLVDSSSGIHARHSEYYIRTVRGDNKDPLTQFMIDSGIPSEPAFKKEDTTTVFSFPVKSPEGSKTRDKMSALDQLELWSVYQEHWCEHKPSVTINVKDDEWMEVGAYVYKNFDTISGVSFLPYSDHSYKQAPYQECTKVEYENLLSSMPKSIDWSKLSEYELSDNTKSSQTFACVGSCEVVDLAE